MRRSGLASGWFACATLAVIVMSAAPARADAVEPPPERCPAGTRPESSHAGPICRPNAECTEHTTCPAGQSCRVLSFCIEMRDCGGMRLPDEVCTLEHVVSECGGGTSCEFAPCVARTVCAEPAAATSPTETPPTEETAPPPPASATSASTPASASGGCRATHEAAGRRGAGISLTLALVLVLTRRRKRHGSSGPLAS